VAIDVSKEECTLTVVSCDSSTLRQLLRCYRELLVIDFVKNILDLDSLFSLVCNERFRTTYPSKIHAVSSRMRILLLLLDTLSKIQEDGRTHLYRGGTLRSCIEFR
jgi:hypothetical protein